MLSGLKHCKIEVELILQVHLCQNACYDAPDELQFIRELHPCFNILVVQCSCILELKHKYYIFVF